MRRLHDIHGGVHPPSNKAQSLTRPIVRTPVPEELVLPLSQHAGAPSEPIVTVGDHVLKGQMIARAATTLSVALHAPTSGEIVAIAPRPLPHPSGMDGTAIVLLDGLDEVPLDDLVLKRIKEMIADLPSAYAQTHLLVTCRVLSYQDPRWQLDAKWPTFELDKLNEAQIDQFIRTWHDQLAAMGVVKQAALSSAKLSHAVRQPDLWRLARNPLLLTLMASLHANRGRLPDDRSVLFAYGCHGNGVNTMPWAGQALAKLAAGANRDEDVVPTPILGLSPRFPFPALRRFYLKAAYLYYGLKDR